jgi:MarR family transcriptional regulator, transcriptional regulator for hemolysin
MARPEGPPSSPPIGLQLASAAKTVSRAFDDALAKAGGSVPTWLILISIKSRNLGNQRELAEAVGIREATLTHHLNAMDRGGLVTRRRDPVNRRVHMVELTEAGEQAFRRMREAAVAFDARLRTGISSEELAELGHILDRLASNVSVADAATPSTASRAPSTAS